MSIQSPTKCEIRGIIRYLVWKGKTPVGVYNEIKTAYGDKAMNHTSVSSGVVSLKTVVRLWMIIQRVEDLQLTDEIVEEIENALHDNCRLIVD